MATFCSIRYVSFFFVLFVSSFEFNAASSFLIMEILVDEALFDRDIYTLLCF